mmetsp:Transcript_41151/g.118923  ORF Transcript_41151/g.118923 Transcript_41151/m.118923 type:complete len:232 (+) Transcript_41151:756-1451(+)
MFPSGFQLRAEAFAVLCDNAHSASDGIAQHGHTCCLGGTVILCTACIGLKLLSAGLRNGQVPPQPRELHLRSLLLLRGLVQPLLQLRTSLAQAPHGGLEATPGEAQLQGSGWRRRYVAPRLGGARLAATIREGCLLDDDPGGGREGGEVALRQGGAAHGLLGLAQRGVACVQGRAEARGLALQDQHRFARVLQLLPNLSRALQLLLILRVALAKLRPNVKFRLRLLQRQAQ